MNGFVRHEKNGVHWLTCGLLDTPHAFTTRLGGASRGIYESLNLGGRLGDEPAAVAENYRRVSDAIGADVTRPVRILQVHKNTVLTANGAHCGDPCAEAAVHADAVVTSEPEVPVMVTIADCVPVLLYDPADNVGAAVHCGWRSSVADILGETVKAMEALGAERSSLRAAIGPCIGRCCFETGPEVPQAVADWLGETDGLVAAGKAPEKYMVDLSGANRRRLLQLGLSEQRIAVCRECTCCTPERYWSHRRLGLKRGLQAAFLVLRKECADGSN